MKKFLGFSIAAAILIPPLAGWSSDQPAKSPLWAVASSVVLPGGGQFYCESYLKGALFGAAQGMLAAMTFYEHMKTEEWSRRFRESGSVEDYAEYEHHFDRRSSLFWWDAGVFCLSVADAFADAHMYGFAGSGPVKIGLAGDGGVGLRVAVFF